jgi:DNA-binding transcriptional regulator YhcF (GntR family)
MQRGDDILLQEPHNQKFINGFYQKHGVRIKTMEETLNALREECCEKKNGQFVYVADANGNREALYKNDELKKKYEDAVNELFSRPANL